MKIIARLKPAEKEYIALKNLLKIYQFVIKSLIYTIFDIRFNIAFAISIISRYIFNLIDIHYFIIKRIFRYLRFTI